MENTKLEKIRKAAGVTAKVLNVIKIILIVVIVLCMVAGIGAMIIKDEVVVGNTVRIHGLLSGDISEGESVVSKWFNVSEPNVLAGLGAIEAAVIAALTLAVVVILRKTLLEIEKSDTPFREEILKRIRIAGILLVLLIVNYSPGHALIVGLTAWCVYCIFDYGIELQKNEDETL